MRRLISSLFRHVKNIFLVSLLNVILFSIFNIPSLIHVIPREYFEEFFKFSLFLAVYSSAIIFPGYFVFLGLIKLPLYAPKLNPWDVIVLCFLVYLVASRFIPVWDEVSMWTFIGADKVLAITDILLFAALNSSELKRRGNQIWG